MYLAKYILQWNLSPDISLLRTVPFGSGKILIYSIKKRKKEKRKDPQNTLESPDNLPGPLLGTSLIRNTVSVNHVPK